MHACHSISNQLLFSLLAKILTGNILLSPCALIWLNTNVYIVNSQRLWYFNSLLCMHACIDSEPSIVCTPNISLNICHPAWSWRTSCMSASALRTHDKFLQTGFLIHAGYYYMNVRADTIVRGWQNKLA